MTVAELIEHLRALPQDLEVFRTEGSCLIADSYYGLTPSDAPALQRVKAVQGYERIPLFTEAEDGEPGRDAVVLP